MGNSELVSIIIPTFKQPEVLSRAINSVLNQSYKNIEIIVVDDNTPGTIERTLTEKIMHQYNGNEKVTYIKHRENKNGSAARNTGFKNSKGKYIMFLDDDDEFINSKIEAQVQKMEYLGLEWGASYTSYIRKKNNKIIMYSAETREGNLLSQELGRNLFIHAGSNLMVRREVVEELNGFDETFTRNQDIEFLIRILMKYKLAYVDEVGLVVNFDDKRKKNIDLEKITNDYLQKFSNNINALEKKEKKKVCILIELQLLRYYLTVRKYKKALTFIIEKRMNLVTILKYIIYLFYRFVTKKAYGFKI